MKWLTLDYIKAHSRLDYNIEDDLLTLYANSAENQVLHDIGLTYSELWVQEGKIPDDIVHASLMLVDFAYTQRCPVDKINWSVVPYTYERLIKPYIRLASHEYEDIYDGKVLSGSDVKIAITAQLDDGLHLADVDFTVSIYNANEPQDAQLYYKSDCIRIDDDTYAVLVSTNTLGVGSYMGRLIVQIPDTDYTSGYRTEIASIDPGIKVIM